MLNTVNNLPRKYKVFILIFADSLSIIASSFLAFLLRFSFKDFAINFSSLAIISLILIPLVISSLYYFDLYKSINRFGGLKIFKSIFISSILGGILLTNILYFGNFKLIIHEINEPTYIIRSLPIIFSLFLILFIISSRYIIQLLIEYLDHKLQRPTNIAIYGESISLIKTAEILERKFNFDIKFFVSNSKNFINTSINEIKIIGLDQLSKKEINQDINYIIITDLPQNNDERSNVLAKLSSTGIHLKYFEYNDLDKLKSYENVFTDVDINLLLSREKIAINHIEIGNFVENKNILITGGGGSIGSELAIQLSKFDIKNLHIIDNSEFNLFQIKEKTISINHKNKIIFNLIDASDLKAMNEFFEQNKIDIIYHAAAYKHVSLGGANFFNFFKNNLYSTKVLLDNFIHHKMEKFILVSTDKATNPANIMGLTKYLAEILCNKYFKQNPNLVILKVRFGNVLNTSGSVIPIFKKQILNGGPVTLSHKEVTRYFMTKDEAVELILQSSIIGKRNELFFLDMGNPIKIYKLATTMINLLGKKLYSEKDKKKENEIEIIIKGLDRGEKLHEKIHDGNLKRTSHERIYLSKENKNLNELENEFILTEKFINFIKQYEIAKLKELVSEKYLEIDDLEANK